MWWLLINLSHPVMLSIYHPFSLLIYIPPFLPSFGYTGSLYFYSLPLVNPSKFYRLYFIISFSWLHKNMNVHTSYQCQNLIKTDVDFWPLFLSFLFCVCVCVCFDMSTHVHWVLISGESCSPRSSRHSLSFLHCTRKMIVSVSFFSSGIPRP